MQVQWNTFGAVHRRNDLCNAHKQIDIAPGFPGNSLTQEEHQQQYWNCLEYVPQGLSWEKAEEILSLVNRIEELEDIRDMIPNLLR